MLTAEVEENGESSELHFPAEEAEGRKRQYQ
jgi:hypothetical protein